MEKFTKGEWEIVCGEDGTFNRSVCQISGDCFVNSKSKVSDDLLADAHLIAAAPEMYYMLKSLLDDNKLVYGDDHDLVDDLLAKARGKIIINGDATPTFNEPERVSTLD